LTPKTVKFKSQKEQNKQTPEKVRVVPDEKESESVNSVT